ncbi:DedA family protein [Pseudonocardia sp. KRD291]|uniref:DedA family protein n=1 Tax=Pseudonocardia sp. KRD291 TaxID=2792007 RepID=UPI001C49FCF5|nr:VTT domain-containing protein [Pseudonocardia sp. KRD291]MBW0105043.1 VTT domain-containing protein [Pseudonocardia sp. KRD291]
MAAAAALGETTIGLGLVLPGESVLVAAAVALPDLRAAVVTVPVVAVAAAGGDLVGYLLGRRFGPRLRASKLVGKVGRDQWDRTGEILRRHGAWAVLGARFLPVVRTLTPAAAGASGLALRRFLPASLVGALLWSTVHVAVGFGARGSALWFERTFGVAGWVVLGSIGVLGTAAWLLRRRRRALAEQAAVLSQPVPVGAQAGD